MALASSLPLIGSLIGSLPCVSSEMVLDVEKVLFCMSTYLLTLIDYPSAAVNVMGDTVVAALVSRDIEDDLEVGDPAMAKGELVKPTPEETAENDPEKNVRAMNTYKIEDHDETDAAMK